MRMEWWGLKVHCAVVREWKLCGGQFSAANVGRGSASAGRARDLTAGQLTPKLRDRTADVRGRQWPTQTSHPTAEIDSREGVIGTGSSGFCTSESAAA